MIATQRSVRAPFAGHPAYDEETRNYTPTPRPGPRVKVEAQEYANRYIGMIAKPHSPS